MATICFDEQTFYLFVLICLMIIGYVLYTIHYQQLKRFQDEVTATQSDKILEHQRQMAGLQQTAFEMQNTEDRHRIFNPLVPPVRRGPLSLTGARYGAPINTPTRGEYGSFQAVGYLKNPDDPKHRLTLMGRRIHSNKYEYYAFDYNDPTNKIKVETHGDEEVYDGYQLDVDGYSSPFTTTVHQLDHPRYIPY